MNREFLTRLDELLKEFNAELSGADIGDVDLSINGRLVGYWSGDVKAENFKDLTNES